MYFELSPPIHPLYFGKSENQKSKKDEVIDVVRPQFSSIHSPTGSIYKIIEVVAEKGITSGMSNVYKISLVGGGEFKVLKELPFSTDPGEQEMTEKAFNREREILGALKHEKFVPELFESWEEQDGFYLVIEYIEGTDLQVFLTDNYFTTGKKVGEQVLINVAKTGLGFFQAIHAKDIIYRDMKPANIMIRKSDGTMVLIDYGIAKRVQQQLTGMLPALPKHTRAGTPGFAPPEAWQDVWSKLGDIYTLGIMLYYVACNGRFPRDTNIDVERADLNEEFRSIIKKAMEDDPADRFPSAQEMLDAIRNIGKPKPVPKAKKQPFNWGGFWKTQKEIWVPGAAFTLEKELEVGTSRSWKESSNQDEFAELKKAIQVAQGAKRKADVERLRGELAACLLRDYFHGGKKQANLIGTRRPADAQPLSKFQGEPSKSELALEGELKNSPLPVKEVAFSSFMVSGGSQNAMFIQCGDVWFEIVDAPIVQKQDDAQLPQMTQMMPAGSLPQQDTAPGGFAKPFQQSDLRKALFPSGDLGDKKLDPGPAMVGIPEDQSATLPPPPVAKPEAKCPSCKGTIRHITQYDRWWCDICKQYMPIGFDPFATPVATVPPPPPPQPPKPTTAVPDVCGKSRADAGRAITDAKLTLDYVSEANHDTVMAGLVLTQSPSAGSQVDPGSKVGFVISLGPKKIEVPDCAGKPQSDALKAIGDLGLAGATTEVNHDTVVIGTVVDQDPKAGIKVVKGSEIKLVVSKGPKLPPPPPPKVKVPNMVDKTLDEAVGLINGLGLGGTKYEEYSDTVGSGLIITQYPDPNTEVDPGYSGIEVVVSLGLPPPPTPSPTDNPPPPPAPPPVPPPDQK